ncbi:MAG TPA: SDR family NAD(P)-dependent oxidoreductase [Dehalococcoidia bacterium]|nr:SDR family NAD(P)-dependent oxidoreductase [Dehalococcoidia bacterium]
MRLEGKVALVTGAGSGIGRATAKRLASEGAKLVVAELNEEAGTATAAQIEDTGGEAVFVRADVSRAEDVEATVAAAVKRFGALHIVHNNAGIMPRGGPVEQMSEEHWTSVIATNLTGVYLGCKYAVPALIAAGGGAIVNTASLAGIRGRPYQAAYVAAKGGVIALTKALAIELAPHNIRVNCICPGGTDTPLIRPPGRTEEEIARSRPAIVAHLPYQRFARPEEMADAVLYLVSAESSYVNGHALVIDGGEWSGTTQGLRR